MGGFTSDDSVARIGEVVQREGVEIRVVAVSEWLPGLKEGKEPMYLDTVYVKDRGKISVIQLELKRKTVNEIKQERPPLGTADLAGYRADKVFIRNASHVPPSQEAVRDMMPELCALLEAEPSAAVRAVLGHFLFVFIHPYFDGNGRLDRFLMNAMLASGGFPWTIIRVEH